MIATAATAKAPVPFWRLSSFYFLYFAQLGVFVPFWTLYLADRGYDAPTIGSLMACMMATRIIGPNIWGWLADKTRQRLLIVRWGIFAACAGFALVFLEWDFWGLVFVLSLYSFFWNAVLPQVEVITIHSLGEKADFYGRIRLWGSIGFVFFVVGCGWLFDLIPLDWVPVIMLVQMLGILICTFTLKPQEEAPTKKESSVKSLLFSVPVISFLLIGLLMQMSHGPLYFFYSLFLQESGYSKSMIGGLWAVGVIAEIILFVYMHRLLAIFGAKNLLLLSLVLAAIRWIMIGHWVDSLWILFVAQLLHAATFGVFHSVSMHFVHSFFGKEHAGQGQSFYASICYGAGGALGAWYSGKVWESLGPEICFYSATIINLVAIGVFLFGMRKADTVSER